MVFLVISALFSRQLKELIEMLESDLVIDETSIDYELHELGKSHCIGLRFGEGAPELVKPCLIILLEDHRIVTVFGHLLQARLRCIDLILKLI